MSRSRKALAAAAVFCAAVGLYDIAYLVTARQGLLVGPRVSVLFPDFLVFHAAAVAWLRGQATMIYDIAAITQFQNALYPDRLGQLVHAVQFRPFFYPPVWVLMLLPLAWLPAGPAFAVFLAATSGLATALVGWRDWPGWLAIMVSPAAVWVLLAGQNTFLSVALLYGGFGLLERSPAVAGILLGLLTFKPQLWVLVPVALLAARQWRALAWMTATAAATSLVSLVVFGPDFWRAFFVAAREGAATHGADQMFNAVSNQLVSPFAAGRLAGLAPGLTDVLQLAGTGIAVVTTWLVFRRHGPSAARLAVLAAATFLVGPYTMNYDLLLLMPAIVAMYRLGAAEGFYLGERAVYALLWLMPTWGWILNQLELPMMPLMILLFGGLALVRLQTAPKGELRPVAAAR